MLRQFQKLNNGCRTQTKFISSSTFHMKPYIILIGLTVFINSCIGDTSKKSKVESPSQPTEKVKMLFYDPHFKFDTTSKLRLDGYYQIRQIFGSYTTNDKDYYLHDPTYGYIQFFNDGFCKVGW